MPKMKILVVSASHRNNRTTESTQQTNAHLIALQDVFERHTYLNDGDAVLDTRTRVFTFRSRIIIEQMEDNTNLSATQRRSTTIVHKVPSIFIQTALLFYQQLPAHCVPICV